MALALGLVADVLGVISFISELPANNYEVGSYSEYRIRVGMDSDSATGLGGGIADKGIRIYNSNGDQIGADGGKEEITAGKYADRPILHNEANFKEQAVTADIIANDNSLCIGYIGATLADQTTWGWTGDWGKICGLDWYYSGWFMQSGEEPYCTWLDKNHDEHPVGMIAINWPAFRRASETDVPPDDTQTDWCGQKEGLRAWDNYQGTPLLEPGPYAKRHAERRNGRDGWTGKAPGDDKLIVSARPHHNATFLCEEPKSYGPDFVSLVDGMYCDMDTRTVMALCGEGETAEEDGCFDLEAARAGNSSGVASSNSFGISSLPRVLGVRDWN